MTAQQSYIGLIQRLAVGESHVRVERIPMKAADAEQVNAALVRVRNSMNQIANRLRRGSTMDFTVESLPVISPDRKSVFAMAVTTKIKDGEEESDEIDI